MITEQEFREIFNLKETCKIPKETLRTYNKQIKGAYMLYLEICDIKSKKFKNVDGTSLCADFLPYNHGFQSFVNTLGTVSKFEVCYIDKHRGKTPFWTYTKYSNEEVTAIKNSAYTIFMGNVLDKLGYKYSKYKLKIRYRNFATQGNYSRNCHSNGKIWWDGIEFDKLIYISKSGSYNTIPNHCIQASITNRTDIWEGKILSPIQNVINEVKSKQQS